MPFVLDLTRGKEIASKAGEFAELWGKIDTSVGLCSEFNHL